METNTGIFSFYQYHFTNLYLNIIIYFLKYAYFIYVLIFLFIIYHIKTQIIELKNQKSGYLRL